MVSCVCNIPTSWHQDGVRCLQHTNKLASSLTRHHSALRWCPVSATYQQVGIKSNTDILAHLDGVQFLPTCCLQHTNKLASSLTRHHSALRWCPVSATYQQVGIKSNTDILAHLDGVQFLQNTNKLASSLTQTS